MFGFKRKGEPKEEVVIDVPGPRHVLNILDGSGHTTVLFDPRNKTEVEKTREQFDQIMAAQRGLAYKVKDGESEAIRSFDPEAEETFVTRQLVGG